MLPGHWLGGTEQSETIVVIDNSMSTQRSIEETTLLAKIRNASAKNWPAFHRVWRSSPSIIPVSNLGHSA